LQLLVKCPGKGYRRTTLTEPSSHADDFPSQWFENVEHLVTMHVNAERTVFRDFLNDIQIVEGFSDHLISSVNLSTFVLRESFFTGQDSDVW
ncbi:hypothetical protein PMAYCL1PPCAC_19792, partial [Pristionchus mayeri]